MRYLSAILLLVTTLSAHAQDRYLVDWDAIGEETLTHLSDLIQINTTNPPGRETLVVNYLQPILEADLVFSHEAGIHVDGLMKDQSIYTYLDPKSVGRKHRFVRGKHSGKSMMLAEGLV